MFCRICGNEVNDEAVVCPKCGCLVKPIETKQEIKQETPEEKLAKQEAVKKSLEQKVVIFTILAFCIGLFSMCLTISEVETLGILLAICNLSMGIVSLIFSIKSKHNSALLIIGVVAFAFSIFAIFFTIGWEDLYYLAFANY